MFFMLLCSSWVQWSGGSLMYAMVYTRLDIVLSQFMANPGQVHWDAVK